jgi:cytochrome c
LLEFPLRTLASATLIVIACLLSGCNNKPVANGGDPAAGQAVFQSACAVCHYADKTDKKVGPGLAGIYHVPALPNGEAVTDANIERWIRNGGGMMPGFKSALNAKQMDDLISYLKTL